MSYVLYLNHSPEWHKMSQGSVLSAVHNVMTNMASLKGKSKLVEKIYPGSSWFKIPNATIIVGLSMHQLSNFIALVHEGDEGKLETYTQVDSLQDFISECLRYFDVLEL